MWQYYHNCDTNEITTVPASRAGFKQQFGLISSKHMNGPYKCENCHKVIDI